MSHAGVFVIELGSFHLEFSVLDFKHTITKVREDDCIDHSL